MKCHLSIPNLFWPDPNFRIEALPHLENLLARSEKRKREACSLEEWILTAFDVARQRDWPVAPLTAEENSGYRLRADPVNLQVRRDHLTLLGPDLLSISESEAASILASLNSHFARDGFHFEMEKPDVWLLRLAASPDLETVPLYDVIGKDIAQYLPKGKDGLKWNQVMNEIQMLLHDHPVNDERMQKGMHPLNSVWFWGGGIFPDHLRSPFSSMTSSNPLARNLARYAKTSFHPLPDNAEIWLAQLEDPGEHLLILEELRLPFRYRDGDEWDSRLRKLESDWFAPLHLAVQKGIDLAITDCEAGLHFDIGKLDLFKFWRRSRSVLDY